MTKDEQDRATAELIAALSAAVTETIRRAVAEEQDRCAAIAESFAVAGHPYGRLPLQVAAKIREGHAAGSGA